MARRSAAHLADLALDGSLLAYVERYRAASVSWAAIARLLGAEHGIDVSGETLAAWATELGYADKEPAA